MASVAAGAAIGVLIVGRGRAGRARARSLERHPRARLLGSLGGRDLDLEAALHDPAVEAVILCTPNLLHAGAVRGVLERDRHVAVEYPLARGAGEARALFALARERGRILHVGHVELLSDSQRVQRGRIPALGRPRGGQLHFRGGLAGWQADPSLAGSEALRALARIHRLLDLFGPARVESAELRAREPLGYRLEVELRFEYGGFTRLVEERRPGLARRLAWKIECETGALDDPGALGAGDVFHQDGGAFLGRILDGRPAEPDEARLLAALARVEEIEALLRAGASPER
ncbi:MAG: Gfo/Idh/MocA family protein [Myxococcota bacterium]